jgi:type 1 fimbria pilin
MSETLSESDEGWSRVRGPQKRGHHSPRSFVALSMLTTLAALTMPQDARATMCTGLVTATPPQLNADLYIAPVGAPVSAWGIRQGSGVLCGESSADRRGGHVGELYLSMDGRVSTYIESGVTYDVFPTNVDGLGYVIGFQQRGAAGPNATGTCSGTTYAAKAGAGPAAPLPVTTNDPCTVIRGRTNALAGGSQVGGTGKNIDFSYTLSLRFIKTATAIGSGAITPDFGTSCYREYVSAGGSANPPFSSTQGHCNGPIGNGGGGGVLVPAAATCAFPTGLDRNVLLPAKPVSSLSGVGSTSAAQNFSIDVDCDNTTRLQYTFRGMTDGQPSVLKLAAGSTATGVGVQLLDAAGAPVVIGSAYDATGNLNAPLKLMFSARYYQTLPKVTPGSLTAVTSLTVTYQ